MGTEGAGGSVRMKREGFGFIAEDPGNERSGLSVSSIMICLVDIESNQSLNVK